MAEISRRSFLTGSALAAGTLATLGVATYPVVAQTPGTDAWADEAEAGAYTDIRAHAARLNPQTTMDDAPEGTCPSLFTEWQFGSLTMPNRFVKSAAGYIGVTSQGITGDLHMQYYGKLGASGVGVVYCDDFAELYDHFKAIPDVGKIVDWTDEDLIAFSDNIHAGGAYAGYQLATMGLVYSGFEPDPTAIFQTSDCMDMTPEEIQDLIADTINAAVTLQRCGFDCVEINAAGENTGQTFMSRARNKRDDDYGPQTFESRTRFVCEIVSGIKEACGADFPVQVLINGVEENDKVIGDNMYHTTVEENIEMCKLIEAAGADALHVRIGPCGQHVAEFAGDLYFAGTGMEGTNGYGAQFDFDRHWQGKLKADQSGLGVMTKVAAEIKKGVSIPVGCVTYMDPARDPQFFEDLIANGDIDFILMNRPLNVDTDYITKLQEGRIDEIRPCTRCMHCHWDSDAEGNLTFSCRTYAPHPMRQITGQIVGGYDAPAAETVKNVMVIGGGPAGMEAARVAAERGHTVTLYEKNADLGGTLGFAHMIKGQHENLPQLARYMKKSLDVAGVTVVTDTEVDADFIASEAPDAVIVATGGVRPELPFEGTDATPVIGITNFMNIPAEATNVVILGSNVQSVDMAMYLMAQGKNVQIVTPDPALAIAAGHSFWVRTFTQPTMKALGARFWPQASVSAVGDGTATILQDTGIEIVVPCDVVLDASDCLPNDPFEGAAAEMYTVGDAARPFNIGEAIAAGNAAARTL